MNRWDPTGLATWDCHFDAPEEKLVGPDCPKGPSGEGWDAVIMPPNELAVQGRAAIREWYASFPPVEEVELPIVDIGGSGDVAFVRGTYSLTISIGGAPEAITDTGKNLAVWRRQEDGSWKMLVDTFNSDLPLPPAEGEHSEGEEYR